jgi:hypothetical protein
LVDVVSSRCRRPSTAPSGNSLGSSSFLGREVLRSTLLLESDIDPLIGRDAVLADLAIRVARHPLVTLTGPGGTGKTHLAYAVIDTDVAALLVIDGLDRSGQPRELGWELMVEVYS